MFGRRMPLKSQNKKADSFFVASIYISNTAGWKQNAVKNFFPRKAIKKLATFPRKISNSRLGRNIRYFKISTFCARRKGLMSLVKLVSRRPQAANFFNKAALEPKIRQDLCETLFPKYYNMPKKDLQRKKISGRVHSTVTLLAHVVHQIYVNCRAPKKTLLET